MSDDPKLSLPGSGYEQLSKILHAYALCGDNPVALDDVAAKAAMNPSVVSRNNGFLVSLELLSGGRAKALTEAGKNLALALGHDLEEDASIAWKRAIISASAAKPVLDMLRVQKSVPAEALPARIAAALGEPDSASTKTGTNTLIEILRKARLIEEADGKVTLTNDQVHPVSDRKISMPAPGIPIADQPRRSPLPVEPAQNTISNATASNGPATIPIHVNIELHLPASAEQSVYDALFKSIRENLLNR